jgi:hypothetical protein
MGPDKQHSLPQMPLGPRETRNDDRALHRTAPLPSAREYALACGNTTLARATLAWPSRQRSQLNKRIIGPRDTDNMRSLVEAEHGEFQVGKAARASRPWKAWLFKYLK